MTRTEQRAPPPTAEVRARDEPVDRMMVLGPAVSDLRVRRRQAELMDDPALDSARHHEALRALARVNRVSFTGQRVWREVSALARTVDRPVRVLDLACGGGDVLVYVARRAERAGVSVDLHGLDASPLAAAHAEKVLAGRGSVSVGDVLASELPGSFDLVTCSLFLHHLERSDAVTLLGRMSDATGRALLVQDLRRSRTGLVLAWIGLHTLTRSDVARFDGIRSVQGAFTLDEVRDLCAEAGLESASIDAVWPQRYTIRWVRGAS